MRIVVFSLIDDWELGSLLTERGHELLAWVRPAWETENRRPLTPGIRKAVKLLLSLDQPSRNVIPKFDIREWLQQTGTPRISCKNVNEPAFIDSLRQMRVDMAIVGAYRQIFKPVLLEVPRLGVINYHPSLLPRYAGPQPAFWALRNGEKETGITIHRMTEGIDAGDILIQEVVPVSEGENVGQLIQRLHHRSASLIVQTVEAISAGSMKGHPQNVSERTYFGKKKVSDTIINWNESTLSLMNLLRAVRPFEPLKAGLRGRSVNIFEARPASAERIGRPGEIVQRKGNHLVVQTGERCLEITKYEIEPFHGWVNRLAQQFLPVVGDRFDLSAGESEKPLPEAL